MNQGSIIPSSVRFVALNSDTNAEEILDSTFIPYEKTTVGSERRFEVINDFVITSEYDTVVGVNDNDAVFLEKKARVNSRRREAEMVGVEGLREVQKPVSSCLDCAVEVLLEFNNVGRVLVTSVSTLDEFSAGRIDGPALGNRHVDVNVNVGLNEGLGEVDLTTRPSKHGGEN